MAEATGRVAERAWAYRRVTPRACDNEQVAVRGARAVRAGPPRRRNTRPDRRPGPRPRHPGPVPRGPLRDPPPRRHPPIAARRQGRLQLRPTPDRGDNPRGRRPARGRARRRGGHGRPDLDRGSRRPEDRPGRDDDRRRRRTRGTRLGDADVLHLRRAMSQQNVEIVRAMLDTWNTQGIDATIDAFDPDVELVDLQSAMGMQDRGRGPAELGRMAEQWTEIFDDWG